MRLAALLHDADDRKYFTPSKPDLKYENAVQIITESLESDANPMLIIDQVCEMISYVSASGNGNSVPERCIEKPYLLWPRFSDRLEAIGTIGMVRCYQYNTECGAPLSCASTPRPQSAEELWSLVKPERFASY